MFTWSGRLLITISTLQVRALETCAYKKETFRAILDQVQKYVDQLNLQSYTNLHMWVQSLDKRVSVTVVTMVTIV